MFFYHFIIVNLCSIKLILNYLYCILSVQKEWGGLLLYIMQISMLKLYRAIYWGLVGYFTCYIDQ
jgi:hypothetical protein